MKQERICVIVLASNDLPTTLQCLESLAQIPNAKCSKIVVKDGTTSTDAIRSIYPDVPIFETTKPHYNEGIKWALIKPFQWICLLSNQVIVDPNFLHEFMAEARSSPEAKIFGAKILQGERILHLGGVWNQTTAHYESIQHENLCLENAPVETVSWDALFMHRSVPETIGLLDPRFHKYWADIDFCFRARRKGFVVKTAPKAKVWVQNIPAEITPQDHYFWWQGRLLWIERNLHPLERHKILKQIIHPELLKAFWNTVSWVLFLRCPNRRQRIAHFMAAIKAFFHYLFNKYN